MNRIQQLIHPKTSVSEVANNSSIRPFSTKQTTPAAQNFLFTPLHYEPKYAYPLIIWLHGPNDNERQLKQVMPLISMRNFVGIGPRGTSLEHNPDKTGFTWQQTSNDVFLAEQRVMDCIDAATQRFNISTGKIFLAGFQTGGTMAMRVAMRNPERFAGVISIGGSFPVNLHPVFDPQRVRKMPILIGHGRDSRQYPIEQVCDDLRLFHSAGLKITLRQYPCADDLTTKMLSDMNGWVMEEVTGNSPTQLSNSHFGSASLN